MSPAIARVMYGLFVAMSAYFLIFSHDVLTAASNMGIALIFDPFDATVRWQDRPMWQRAWLIVHVAIVFGLFLYGLMK